MSLKSLPRGLTGPARRWSPELLSALLTMAYLLLCGLYILISSALASRVAESTAEMHSIEVLKGLLFVLTTGAVFYVFARKTLGHLAQAREELDRQRLELLQGERQRVTAFMARAIGHDLNNILQVMFGHVDLQEMLTRENATGQPFRREMRQGLEDLARLVGRLNAGAMGAPSHKPVHADLVLLASRALDYAAVHPDLRGAQLRLTGVATLTARVAETALQPALLNLLLNAGRATGGRGRVELRVLRSGERALLEVHDDGPGVPDALSNKLFRESVSAFDGGHGLGLLSVAACVEELGGEVTAHRSDLGGACFRISLPLAPAQVAVGARG